MDTTTQTRGEGFDLTRRDLQGGLLWATIMAAAGLSEPSVRHPARQGWQPIFDFAIAGGAYHGLRLVLDELIVGDRLTLLADEGNPHDRHAVAVLTDARRMLGYVPRHVAKPVSALLRQGHDVSAEITGFLDASDADIAQDLVFTSFTNGDPRIRVAVAP